MRLEQISYFLSVAEHGNITASSKITLHFSACTEQTDHVVGTGDRSAAV